RVHAALVVADVDDPVVEARARLDFGTKVGLPAQLAVGRVDRVEVALVVAEVDAAADHERRGLDVALRAERPRPLAPGGVERGEVAVELSDVDAAVAVRGAGHVPVEVRLPDQL